MAIAETINGSLECVGSTLPTSRKNADSSLLPQLILIDDGGKTVRPARHHSPVNSEAQKAVEGLQNLLRSVSTTANKPTAQDHAAVLTSLVGKQGGLSELARSLTRQSTHKAAHT